MNTLKIPASITSGMFHVAFHSSRMKSERNMWLLNGLKELSMGMVDLINSFPDNLLIQDHERVCQDLLDIEKAFDTILEEACEAARSVNEQSTICQFHDAIVALRWAILTHSDRPLVLG
ncbi:hypothetical protein [Acidithiobacillus sp.]